jgi:hypothetical protein
MGVGVSWVRKWGLGGGVLGVSYPEDGHCFD